MRYRPPQPLVTVLTPVYNGARYLRECIESVLAQDYENWEYIIVNNRSTDGTLEIAESYAAKDQRIQVRTNKTFVSMPQNFNNAFGMVSDTSGYCKVVCADDWLLPQCLSRMVQLAVANPTVGIVCCYQQSGDQIRWRELPPSVEVMSGRDVCRLVLLEAAQILGAPTAHLYRADLLRSGKPFFPNNHPHSDTSACCEQLEHCDFGMVHEVLAVERVHADQITSKIERYAAGDLAYLEAILEYGPRYLTPEEFVIRRDDVFDAYYRGLGRALLRMKGAGFWAFQRARLGEMGHQLSWPRVLRAAAEKAVVEAKRPVSAVRKFGTALSSRLVQ